MADQEAYDDQVAIVLEVVCLCYDACHIFQWQSLKGLNLTILHSIAREKPHHGGDMHSVKRKLSIGQELHCKVAHMPSLQAADMLELRLASDSRLGRKMCVGCI